VVRFEASLPPERRPHAVPDFLASSGHFNGVGCPRRVRRQSHRF
jgi:hypothetical protein